MTCHFCSVREQLNCNIICCRTYPGLLNLVCHIGLLDSISYLSALCIQRAAHACVNRLILCGVSADTLFCYLILILNLRVGIGICVLSKTFDGKRSIICSAPVYMIIRILLQCCDIIPVRISISGTLNYQRNLRTAVMRLCRIHPLLGTCYGSCLIAVKYQMVTAGIYSLLSITCRNIRFVNCINDRLAVFIYHRQIYECVCPLVTVVLISISTRKFM